MADDEETSDTPWGLIFLGFFMLILAAFFFTEVSTFYQATYQPSASKPRVFDNTAEMLFGSSDLSYKPGASLMST